MGAKMMFNILDRKERIRQNRFLEASAGTGKTFSIENLYARLLIENKDLSIENILVVTFTKAAAQDLRNRIKKNLTRLLQSLEKEQERPDFLKAHCDLESKKELELRLLLEEALYHFDQAAIFTIHGFCFKALQENSFEAGVSGTSPESSVLKEELIDLVHTFLVTELNPHEVSLAQLEIVIKHHQGKVQKLKECLLQNILKGAEIICPANYEQCFHSFLKVVDKLKEEGWQQELVLSDLLSLAPQYLEICDRSGKLKKENLEKLMRFAALFAESPTPSQFDQQLKDQFYVYHAFREIKKKAKAKLPLLNYPQLLRVIEEHLWPVVQKASEPMAIFANLAASCQKKLQHYLEENNKLEFSFLLKKMQQVVAQNDVLKEKIREQYQVVVIDEFQDTDPLQWEIFHQLFFQSNSSSIVYLVGDPKQSIYSFRSADIYTYLQAEKAMGSACKASLTVNYRSQPSLIDALNLLFSEENAPGWIDLPLLQSYLPYKPVFAPPHVENRHFKDTLGSVHFSVALADPDDKLETLEENFFFPFYAQEMQRLKVLEGISYQEMAILVHDRYQAKRLMRYLKQQKVPSVLQKTSSIAQSIMLPAFRDLLLGFLYPRRESLFKAALAGKIIALDFSQMQVLQESLHHAKALEQALSLKETLVKNGLGPFFKDLLDSCWLNEERSVREKMVSSEGGATLIDELLHIVSLLIEYEAASFASPEKIAEYIEEIILTYDTENEEFKIQQDLTLDAVNVLTIHASKGLEYEIVFALGLCNRTVLKENLISDRHKAPSSLAFFPKESLTHVLHRQECDAEKMRQLYVAMTRAKYRLYMPCIKGWKVPKVGGASPIELFLARLNQPLCKHEEIYFRLGKDVVANLEAMLPLASGKITLSHPKSEELALETFDSMYTTLVEPVAVSIPGKTLYCSSFSSLAQHTGSNPSLILTPKDFTIEEKNPHSLPAGRETGILFHEVLQKISFQMDENELRQAVHGYLKSSHFSEWVEVFVSMIKMLLSCPLGEEKVCLKDLDAGSCFKEMEFLYPQGLMKGINIPPGFIHGIVDLVCKMNGKYYLIDWKTNWLGEDDSFYSREGMHQAMMANHYHLQASLYAKAFKQYVKLFDIRPFEELFGGAFYIFLRGVKQDGSCGIYHFFPELHDE
ncbi:Uncharacterized protein PHSC3_000782 [Chlamydiales bacterium STE3]|nr:Uncharacterized protein PHSC3_000782 [Chlamydiales bacterium STE3]